MSASKSLMAGDLWQYLVDAQSRQTRANRLFTYVLQGKIKVGAPTIYPLADGVRAHADLERGCVAGKILLRPWGASENISSG